MQMSSTASSAARIRSASVARSSVLGDLHAPIVSRPATAPWLIWALSSHNAAYAARARTALTHALMDSRCLWRGAGHQNSLELLPQVLILLTITGLRVSS